MLLTYEKPDAEARGFHALTYPYDQNNPEEVRWMTRAVKHLQDGGIPYLYVREPGGVSVYRKNQNSAQ